MNTKVLKILFGSLLFISTSLNIFPQWSTDPNNNLIVGYGLDPYICSDSAGGAYITYDYNSTSYPRWLALEKLDKYGYKPWGINKRILGEYPEKSGAQIIEDGEGGVIISYKDRYENLPSWTQKVRVQKVDSNGVFLWGTSGVKATLENINQGLQKLVSDGNGGCMVTWKTVSSVFYVNRIGASGERLWGDSGKVLGISHYSGTEPMVVRTTDGCYYVQTGEYIYRIRENGEIVRRDSVTLGYPVADPSGGVVLSGRVWNGMIPKLVAQRKDSLGNNLWQEPYVEIADSLGLGSFRIGTNNGMINYAWLGTYNGKTDRPCFQAVNLEGNLVYQNKISLSEDPSGTTFIGIISSYDNNTIFSWSISGEVNSIYAQMYDTLGNKIWSENGVIVSHPRMTYQQYITDGRDGFIVAGLINNFTVVAQQVSKNGFLGEIITTVSQEYQEQSPIKFTLYQNYPNPFNPSTTINYYLPSVSNVSLVVYDILGKKVKELVNTKQEAGNYEVQLNATSLANGVYIYQLKAGDYVDTKKMILLK